ncbi:MAG: rRNA pseudouridine synthase [Myxococcales bacterium]|nr:rRNA pseudouridine synthase [Myxococcales bacterium]
MRERLQKILAAAGVGSRRHCETLVREGRVAVNGHVVEIGASADPQKDRITLDGRPVHREPLVYWILHKPRGVLTTVRDPEARRTVLDLVDERRARIFPVGRLDRDTEGLLLLTNDGELMQALLHPSRESPRVYRVEIEGRLSPAEARRLASGVDLGGGETTAAAEVGEVDYRGRADVSVFALTLIEGRKRQIRRSLEALGHRVKRLIRTRMGPLTLGKLPYGQARELTSAERRKVLEHARRHGARDDGSRPIRGGRDDGRRPIRGGAGSRSGGRSSRGRDRDRDPSARAGPRSRAPRPGREARPPGLRASRAGGDRRAAGGRSRAPGRR